MKQGENGVPTAVQFIEEYNRETIEKIKKTGGRQLDLTAEQYHLTLQNTLKNYRILM